MTGRGATATSRGRPRSLPFTDENTMIKTTLLAAAACAGLALSPLAPAAGPDTIRPATLQVLSKPVAALTADDLHAYLDLAFSRRITVEQAQAFLSRLSAGQLAELGRAIDALGSTLPSSPQDAPARVPAQAQKAVCDPVAQQQGFCWRQFIEYNNGEPSVQARGVAWRQRYTTICDNDPGDEDLVLFFDIASLNPDKLRWHTTSPGLFTIVATDGLSLNGFDFDNQGAHLCMSNRASAIYTDAEIAASLIMSLKR